MSLSKRKNSKKEKEDLQNLNKKCCKIIQYFKYDYFSLPEQ